MASNKNYIVEQIYVISSDVTAQRINLRKFDSRKVELEEKIARTEKEMAERFSSRRKELVKIIDDLRKSDKEGQEKYEVEKKIKEAQKELNQNDASIKSDVKEVQKEIDQNDTMIEKSEDLLENMEEKCQHSQQELEDSIDYKLPDKIG